MISRLTATPHVVRSTNTTGMAAMVKPNSTELGLITRMSNWAELREKKTTFWDVRACLHGEPNEAKKVELEEAYHHLIVLIHVCMSTHQDEESR